MSASSHSLTCQVRPCQLKTVESAVDYMYPHILTDLDIQMCIQDAVLVLQSTPPSAFVRHHEPTSSQPSSIPPEAVSSGLSRVCVYKVDGNLSLYSNVVPSY